MEAWQAELKQASKFHHSFSKTNFSPLIPEQVRLLAEKSSPIAKQFYPAEEENFDSGLVDPIGDRVRSKGNGIIHRYGNRILITPTKHCPIHCRYCFRRNELSENSDYLNFNIDKVVSYLNENSNIEEVILTGGDPLVLTNIKLENIFRKISQVNSVKFFRIHTRTPIVLPKRIDKQLLQMLKDYNVKLVVHSNHIDEITNEVYSVLKKTAEAGICMLSQTVLLKGVNDSADNLEMLYRKFDELGIRPYYLHHPDKVKGAMHFYLSEDIGKKLFAELRQRVSGWMLPHYVVDGSDATGKRQV